MVYEGEVLEGIKAYLHSMDEYQGEVVGRLSLQQRTSLLSLQIMVTSPRLLRVLLTKRSKRKPEQYGSFILHPSAERPNGQFHRIEPEDGSPIRKATLAITSLILSTYDSSDLITGDPVRITVRYQSLIPLYPVCWGFTFFCTGDGTIPISTSIIGEHGKELTFPAGEGEVSAVIKEFPFS